MNGRDTRMLLSYYPEQGANKSALARQLGVSRDTVHRWIRDGELDRDLDTTAVPHTCFRHELFDLVWSEPTRTIAKRLGVSDVGLAKACRRADLLLPPRGYWAKLAAGKAVKKPPLPPRGCG
jgi:hypothetical protein